MIWNSWAMIYFGETLEKAWLMKGNIQIKSYLALIIETLVMPEDHIYEQQFSLYRLVDGDNRGYWANTEITAGHLKQVLTLLFGYYNSYVITNSSFKKAFDSLQLSKSLE